MFTENNENTSKFQLTYITEEDLDRKYNILKELEKETEAKHNRIYDYLTYPGTSLDEKKRVTLLDWMMDLCTDIGFKRDTYHQAVVIQEIYMSQVKKIDLSKYQLLGITSLLISAKLEETKLPPLDMFSKATAEAYNTTEIKKFEKVILTKLSWKVIYPNMCKWGNIIMNEWDIFIKNNIKDRYYCTFKNDSLSENYLFKNLFIIIDVISLDYYHIFFNEKYIVISLCYLLLGIAMKCFGLNDIFNCKFNESNNVNFCFFKEVFGYFIQSIFNVKLSSLDQYLTYVGQFFNICFEYKDSSFIGLTQEDTLQFQTKNPSNLDSIKNILEIRNCKI